MDLQAFVNGFSVFFFVLLLDYMANQFKKYHSKTASEITLSKVF